MLRTMHNRRQT